MPFTPSDFRDLVRLLEEKPEWRSELRRLLLTEELLSLPLLVQQIAGQLQALTAGVETLAEAQARTEARLDRVETRLDQVETRLDQVEARLAALEEAQLRLTDQLVTLTAQVDALAEAQRRTEVRLGQIADRVGSLEGDMLEIRYERRTHAYFSGLARRLRVVEPQTLAELLDDALETGLLTEDERKAILLADLVLSGRRREDQADIYLLVEVSVGIGISDVERARDRAGLLARLGRPVLPVVAGHWIRPEALALVRESGLRYVLDGRADDPAA